MTRSATDLAIGLKRPWLLAALALTACGQRDDGGRTVPIRVPLAVASAATPPTPPVAIAVAGPAAWSYSPDARFASYGSANAPALLVIACERPPAGAPRLVVARYAAADRGAQALFAIQGSKGILRLPVSAVKVGRGYAWRGFLDAADPRREVLLGAGLKATVPGGGELILPPMGPAAAVIAECAAAAPRAAPQSLPNLPSNPAVSPVAR